MTEQTIDYQAIKEHILQAIPTAESAEAVMDFVVTELKDKLPHYDWIGIYLLRGDLLELGPYRGEPSPHTKIGLGQGICGMAASAKETIVVPDVNADPRYLACSIKTKSEIVVPIMRGTTCLGEIDIDSHTPHAFTKQDRTLLEAIARELAVKLNEETPRPI